MSNGAVAGTVSGSVLLGHKGMEMPGERLMWRGGQGPVKKSLGCHGKELDSILVVSGSDPGCTSVF